MENKPWLQNDVEDLARGYAITSIIPAHFNDVKTHKEKMLAKITKAVKDRLTKEIQHWDYRAADLKQKESAGKTNTKLNSENAARKAEELAARMQKRLAEIENEKMISAMPPVIVGGALVIPGGLLSQLMGQSVLRGDSAGPQGRAAIEKAAMQAVMDIEMALGFEPRDVSVEKCGYDVESLIPETKREKGTDASCLRFIEVKGRAKGADSVTVTKNEILTALNKPEDFLLAVVEVDGTQTRTMYLKKPFQNAPDFYATSVNYPISELLNQSEIAYQE